MKKGPKGPDYEVATENWIEEQNIDEKEFMLIETYLRDIIKKILDNDGIGGE